MNKNMLSVALKKKALGAAIAVAISTPAFADVTMFGIVDVGLGSEGDTNIAVRGGEGRTVELPSIWGIKGSEDLGGGLTASFALESDLEASTGGTYRGGTTLSNNGARFWARQANVSLSNDMGSLTLGRIYSPALLAIAGVDPRSFYETQSGLWQYLTLVPTTNTNTHVDVFLANAVQAKFTPGPLSVGIAYGAGEVDGDSGANSNMHIGITYSAEDLTVMANYIKNKGNNATNDSLGENEKQAVGAKYMMGDLKLAGYYITGEATDAAGATSEAKGYSLGVTFMSGNNEFDVSYYNTEVEDATDAETDDIILAYRNNLTERTTLYAKLCSSDKGANSGNLGACNGAAGQNETYYGFGVFHKF
tara:strand:+ start:35 stop:1123 length:1089 start_codon:yes stop_codon:yes gene_type:complete